MNPRFSVIIPVYNRADLITETIASVQAQTFTDWECIVVDDGSTDNTAEVVKSIAAADSRVRYVYQKNAERCVARNNGAEQSKGQFLCFLDSDDLYSSDHLLMLNASILDARDEVAMYFVNMVVASDDGQRVEVRSSPFDASVDYFIRNSVIPARVCLHRRIFDEGLRFLENTVIAEDTVLWTRVISRFPVHQLAQSTVIYRKHDDNSVNIRNNCFRNRLDGLQVLFSLNEMKGRISSEQKNAAVSACHYGIAKHHEFHRRFWKMLWNIMVSIRHHPSSVHTKAKIYMLYGFFR